jgi:hypothetical protein
MFIYALVLFSVQINIVKAFYVLVVLIYVQLSVSYLMCLLLLLGRPQITEMTNVVFFR